MHLLQQSPVIYNLPQSPRQLNCKTVIHEVCRFDTINQPAVKFVGLRSCAIIRTCVYMYINFKSDFSKNIVQFSNNRRNMFLFKDINYKFRMYFILFLFLKMFGNNYCTQIFLNIWLFCCFGFIVCFELYKVLK